MNQRDTIQLDTQRPRPRRGRDLPLAPSLVGLALIACLMVGGSLYLNFVQRGLWGRTVGDVLEITSESAHSFEVFLDKDMNKLSILAEALRSCASDDIEGIVRQCAYFNSSKNIYGVVNLDTGMLYVGYQDSGIKLPEEALEQYRSFPDSGVREPYVGDYTGLKMIGYYERIEFTDGTPAVVYEGASVTSVAEQFTLSFFDGQGFSYVVNAEGDILVRPSSSTGPLSFTNVLGALEDDPENDPADIEALRESLAEGKKGAVRLALGDDQMILGFVPIHDSDGWSMLTIIPDDVIMGVANDLVDATTFLGLIATVCVAIIVGYLLLNHIFRKRMDSQDMELLYREQLFGVLADSTTEIFLMVRPGEGTAEYVSPNVERILGISPDEVYEDVTTLALVDDPMEGHADALAREVAEAPEQRITRTGERIRRTDGTHLWFNDTIYRAEVDREARDILVLSDRTEERRAEEVLTEALRVAEVANESKSAFLANVSHDIRTPMNAIMGLCVLLKRDIDHPELLEEHIRRITASSQHMLGLLNDVLDMSKIESGRTTLSLGEFSLAELADEIVTIARPQAEAKGQSFRLRVTGVRDDAVVGDMVRVTQVINNLVANALRFTQEGGHILFEMEQLPSTQRNFSRIRFQVTDDGPGMAPDFVDHVFDPFSREQRTLTNKVMGTGLGLAITKSLVELMGGTIDVASALGQGSTFTVDLEFRLAQSRDNRARLAAHGISRVLVVDDSQPLCEEVAACLVDAGADCDWVTDGADAVDLEQRAVAQGRPHDLIIVDWKMPVMDGAATIARLRPMVGDDVLILVLSGFDRADAEAACGPVGPDGYLQKPFFISSLMVLLDELACEAPAEGRDAEESPTLEGCHFLAAEDNMLSASILEELLDMEGATVELTANGREALETFLASEPGHFDGVLMDVQMPEMDGHAATRAIRASDHPDAQRIPIIAMTANAFVDDVHDALAAGMDMHMAKPVEIERLGEVFCEAKAKRARAMGSRGEGSGGEGQSTATGDEPEAPGDGREPEDHHGPTATRDEPQDR